jgi:hypothetical protein
MTALAALAARQNAGGSACGPHALARDAAGGVRGDDEVGGDMMTGSCGAVLVRVGAFS